MAGHGPEMQRSRANSFETVPIPPSLKTSCTSASNNKVDSPGQKFHDIFIRFHIPELRSVCKGFVATRAFIITVMIIASANALMLSFYQPSIYDDSKIRNTYIANFAVIVVVAYASIATIQIIAYGLQSNILDVFIVISGVLYIVLSKLGIHTWAEIAASLMALKLLQILAVFSSVKFILRAIAKSMTKLFSLSLVILIVMTFLSLFGMELFSGALHGGCFANYTSPSGSSKLTLVSDYPCFLEGIGRGNGSPGTHACPEQSVCMRWQLGPNSGITSFDNFFKGLVTVFQVISLEGWSRVFYLHASALGSTWVWVYFFIAVSVGSLFILNIWLGVLTGVFKDVCDQWEDGKKTMENNRDLKNNRVLKGYYQYIQSLIEADTESFDEPDSMEKEKNYIVLICLKVAKNKIFLNFITAVHIFNILLLMTIHYPIIRSLDQATAIVNYICTTIYILECLILLTALGLKGYFRSGVFNIVDFLLTVGNVIDILFLPVPQFPSIGIIINACRGYKIICILKYRDWNLMTDIANTLIKLFSLIISLLALLLIFLFIFTVIGHRLFSERLKVTEYFFPNFDTFFSSFLLVFQLMTTEDWHDIFYSSLAPWVAPPNSNSTNVIGYSVAIYFIVAIIIGGFILAGAFFAIIVDNLSETQSPEEDDDNKHEQHTKKKEQYQLQRHFRESVQLQAMKTAIIDYPSDSKRNTNTSDSVDSYSDTSSSSVQSSITYAQNPLRMLESSPHYPHYCISQPKCEEQDRSDTVQSMLQARSSAGLELKTGNSLECLPFQQSSEQQSPNTSNLHDSLDQKFSTNCAKKYWKKVKNYFGAIKFDPSKELASIPLHTSFFILSPDSRFRIFCYKIVQSRVFQVITYTMTFLSCVLLMLEVPIGADNGTWLCWLQLSIVYVDLVFVLYFMFEVTIKMTVLGVIIHKDSYLRGFFNIIDFTVTVMSLVPIIAFFRESNNNSDDTQYRCRAYSYIINVAFSTVRVVRVLRTLRIIRISGLYLVVMGIVSSMRSIVGILFVNLLTLIIFAIIGTHIFRGRYGSCSDPTILTEPKCKGDYFTYPSGHLDCPVVERRIWEEHDLNFNNIGRAILTLFVMLTTEGWEIIMYRGLNSHPLEEERPVRSDYLHSKHTFLYFISFMVIMTFVLIQLFIGALIVTFQNEGVKSFNLCWNQRTCLYYALTLKPLPRYTPKYKIQQTLVNFISHQYFKIFTFFALLLNCILLATQSSEGSSKVEVRLKVVYWSNFGFTVIFFVEAVIKIIALTPANYFHKPWNVFDFIIVIGSLIEVVVQRINSEQYNYWHYTHIASSFRVLRLLRLIPQVQPILWTVFMSLRIFPWIGLLLLLIFFSYAVVGMQLFGTIEQVSLDASEHSEITQFNNFGNFPQAMLVMFRVASGENWQDVMISCKSGLSCYPNSTNTSTCGSDIAYFFFPSFLFITAILVLQLFVTVIIDNFDYLVKKPSRLVARQLPLFVKEWSSRDPEAKGELPPQEVLYILMNFDPPLGWGRLCSLRDANSNMRRLHIPLRDGKVALNAVLIAVVRTSLNIGCPGCPECIHHCNAYLRDELKKLFPNLSQRLDEVLEEGRTVSQEYAALFIQQKWNEYKLRRATSLASL